MEAKELTLSQFSLHLRGDVGTSITLEVIPSGEKVAKQYTFKRGPVAPSNRVLAMALSRDGKWLAVGCMQPHDDRTVPLIRLISIESGKELRAFLTGTEELWGLDFSPDQKYLATAGHTVAKVWDVSTGKELAVLKGHQKVVCSVAFHPEGKLLATGGTDESVKFWEIPTWTELPGPANQQTVESSLSKYVPLAFSPDGLFIALGGEKEVVHIWEAKNRRKVQGLPLTGKAGQIADLAFSPDSSLLACSFVTSRQVHIWGTRTPGTLAGNIIVALNRALAEAEAHEPSVRATLQGHTNMVSSVAFSPDGKTLASGSWDFTIKLWIVATGKEQATLRGHRAMVLAVAYSPDGKTLASSAFEGSRSITLWDMGTGNKRAILVGHDKDVKSLAFSPSGKTLASGSQDNTVKLWDVATGKEQATLQGHTNWVFSVAFSPDGKTLASGSDDQTIRLWDVAAGKELTTLKGHTERVNSVAFSPDGKTLASGSTDNTIKLWNFATGKEEATLQGHTERVLSVAFSPDGRTLASGSWDSTIKLWKMATGKERATLHGHTSPVSSVAFSPDGKTLASGSMVGGKVGDTLPAEIKLWTVLPVR